MKLTSDKFRTALGGYSRLVDVFCRECNHHVAVYQKDRPGVLRRMYLDRIYWPNGLTGLHLHKLETISPFVCEHCGEVLGTSYIYRKENRIAFKMYQDAVIKKVRRVA